MTGIEVRREPLVLYLSLQVLCDLIEKYKAEEKGSCESSDFVVVAGV